MPVVRIKDLYIDAPPEKVFDLVSDVVNFSRVSSFIREIKEVTPGLYRWKVEVLGITLEWEAEVVESRKPEVFAWQSVSGVYNRGRYEMRPDGGGTRLSLTLEFRLTGGLLDVLTGPLLEKAASMVAGDIMNNVKKILEA